jgi:endoglycosylceramidase
MGYELINEPWAGDVFRAPELLLPGVAGKRNLQPLYAGAAAAIREHDKEQLIFYEPVTWGMLDGAGSRNGSGAGGELGSGFTEPPGGPTYANRSVFSFHYYCSSFGGDRKLCDPLIAPAVFAAVRADVGRLGGSSFMTEFGICDHTLEECDDVMALADRHLVSWCDDGGNLGVGGAWSPPAQDYQSLLSRTYAQAVAGKIINMSYVDDATRAFELCFAQDLAIEVPSVVFVAWARHYPSPSGYRLTHTPNLVATVVEAAHHLRLSPSSVAKDGQTACVRLKNTN